MRTHPAETPLLQVPQEGRSCTAGLCTRLSLTSRQTRQQERGWRNVLPETVLFSFLNLINFCCCCLFLRLLFNYISPFSFLPSNPSVYSTLLSFNLMASFFLLIFIACIYVLVYTYIPIYSLLSPCNITSVCASGKALLHLKPSVLFWEGPLLLSALLSCLSFSV